jgi:hypothetical protein
MRLTALNARARSPLVLAAPGTGGYDSQLEKLPPSDPAEYRRD